MLFAMPSFRHFLMVLMFFLNVAYCFSQATIKNLQVDYQTEPLGIDVFKPHFSWQMHSTLKNRGLAQSAYQIVVTDEHENRIWDSKKTQGDSSLGIAYEGDKLQPTTRYNFEITVWDQNDNPIENSSWFETGLLNTTISGWHGAQWIGGGDQDMVLYSHYLSVFKMGYTVQLDQTSNSTKASFVFGANDRRLMSKDLNIQGVVNKLDQSYIRFELDVSEVDGSAQGAAKFNVYRVGYASSDAKTVPFRTFAIPLKLINQRNKYDRHTFSATCVFGLFQVYLDGTDDEYKISQNDDQNPPPFGKIGFNLNPVGNGNDYISYPMLADIGFEADPGQKAVFSNIHIENYRSPSNLLFSEPKSPAKDYDGIFEKILVENRNFSIRDDGFHITGDDQETLILADPSRNAMPMLRNNIELANKTISKARLYVTARGIYEIYLNGHRVGNDYFNPGLTQYNKHHMYQTYDVTSYLHAGSRNVLGAWLGEGWWSGNITYNGENWNYFGDRPSLLAQMIVTYSDGSEQIVTSNDRQWKLFTDGPIRYGSFFQGEVYDTTKEQGITGWSTAAYDDSQWKSAVEVPLEGTTFQNAALNYDTMELIGQIGNNASIVKTLTAIDMVEVRPKVYLYDMGQNMVGVPKIQLPTGTAGDTITVRYSEVKYPDLSEYKANVGMVMLENIRAALAQDLYVRKGRTETVQPRFTFHGFRYLEITGLDTPLPLENVKGLVISSIKELVSNYTTSNILVNKLWENITWSLRGNFLSIPTDTPARNERMGWSGDINVFSEAATYLAQVDPFLRRHMLAMRDIQRPDGRFTDVAPVGGGFGGTLWGSAGIIIPWELYQQYGDLEVLQENYDAMKRYVEFLNSKIDPATGILNEGPLGDWLSPEGFKNDDTLFWAAYHLYDLEILSKSAALLGKTEDGKTYRKQYDERKAFFNVTFVDSVEHKTLHLGHQSLRFGPPLPEAMRKKAGDLADTQASYAIPLHLGVFDVTNKAFAINNLAGTVARKNEDESGVQRPEFSLMTGFIGTASLPQALSDNGRNDLAYRLLQQTSYPSWLYSVKNGATTIWERLNSYTEENGFGGNNSMNSFNHYSFGSVASWMYNYSLGIQRDPQFPGFKHFILSPTPDPNGEMTWAKGYYDSMYGRIESAWQTAETGWTYTTTIPPNTSATLYLAAPSAKNITEKGLKLKNGNGIQIVSVQNQKVTLELASGRYEFLISK
jgi:alpha-L-rhamnosidase